MRETVEGRDVNEEIVEHAEGQDSEPRRFTLPPRRRLLLIAGVLGALVLAAVLPPLINVNRFRRQIATSIGASLGRPVHLGSVTLSLLPLPGLTLENFVVSEDPAFGTEPVIYASSVRATLRVSSLWRRRVEFSRISLDEPTSVNLVHRADGRWNVESILLQAARLQAAPTGQRGVGDAPRFPYIEATSARVNLKMGLEKMPLSLTEAKFALWLSEPELWKLRLEAHPTRTDTAATDTGTLRLEGTLGRAPALREVPLEMKGEWSAAPLGAVSKVLLGWDAGFRGLMTLNATVHGTLGENVLESQLLLKEVRRADFVPAQMLNVDLSCKGEAKNLFHTFVGVRCAWPSDKATKDGGNDAGMIVTGDLQDVRHPQAVVGQLQLKDVSATWLLDAMRIASNRISAQLTATGAISGNVLYGESSRGQFAKPTKRREQVVAGNFRIANARVARGEGRPFLDGDVEGELRANDLTILPLPIHLGAPAPAFIDGHVGWDGYRIHLTGPVLRSRLLELADALPQFGDGLREVLPPASNAADPSERVDLFSSRLWTRSQMWTQAAPRQSSGRRGHANRR